MKRHRDTELQGEFDKFQFSFAPNAICKLLIDVIVVLLDVYSQCLSALQANRLSAELSRWTEKLKANKHCQNSPNRLRTRDETTVSVCPRVHVFMQNKISIHWLFIHHHDLLCDGVAGQMKERKLTISNWIGSVTWLLCPLSSFISSLLASAGLCSQAKTPPQSPSYSGSPGSARYRHKAACLAVVVMTNTINVPNFNCHAHT